MWLLLSCQIVSIHRAALLDDKTYLAISSVKDLMAKSGSVPWDASHSFSRSRWVEMRGPMLTLITSEGKLRTLAGVVL